MKKLKAGTIVLCPGCEALIAEVAQDLKPGNPVAADDFTPIGVSEIEVGVPSQCAECGQFWAFNQRIFTNKGWWP